MISKEQFIRYNNEENEGFDGETKDLLGVDASEGEKFLDIKGVITN